MQETILIIAEKPDFNVNIKCDVFQYRIEKRSKTFFLKKCDKKIKNTTKVLIILAKAIPNIPPKEISYLRNKHHT